MSYRVGEQVEVYEGGRWVQVTVRRVHGEDVLCDDGHPTISDGNRPFVGGETLAGRGWTFAGWYSPEDVRAMKRR